MRTDDASVANGDPVLAALMREGVTVAHIVDLLQTAYPKTWERHLRNRLGAADPADLTPAELAEFTKYVFWAVKQTGIRDPAAWLAFCAQLEAKGAPAAPAKLGSPVEIGNIAAQAEICRARAGRAREQPSDDLRRIALRDRWHEPSHPGLQKPRCWAAPGRPSRPA